MTQAMLSPFLRISGELRNEIYKLLLLHQDPFDIRDYFPINRDHKETPESTPPPRKRSRSRVNTGIFLVSKLIHQEASSIFYGYNMFEFRSLGGANGATPITGFHAEIGPTNAGFIRTIRIDWVFMILSSWPLPGGDVVFDDPEFQAIHALQRCCLNVRTVVVGDPGWIENSLVSFPDQRNEESDDESRAFNIALPKFDKLLRGGWSPLTVIVRVLWGLPYSVQWIKKRTELHGWEFQTRGSGQSDTRAVVENDTPEESPVDDGDQ